MNSQGFLEAAVAIADAHGHFDSQTLSKKLKITRDGLGVIASELRRMRLLATPKGNWQLLGIARELAQAMNGRNVDRAAGMKGV
jgi:hypothetical protein